MDVPQGGKKAIGPSGHHVGVSQLHEEGLGLRMELWVVFWGPSWLSKTHCWS